PGAPRMTVERVRAIRLQKRDELASLGRCETRADTHVVETPGVVVQTEQQRTDGRVLPILVPAEPGDDAIALALVLHLEHHALVRLVRAVFWLRHHAIEPCPLEPPEPIAGDGTVPRGGCDVQRWR